MFKLSNIMNNIIPYLWQSSQSKSKAGNSIKIVDTVIKDKQKLQWYFFSQKQNRILRKKSQNCTATIIVEELEKKESNKFQGMYIGVMWTFQPFSSRTVSASELVESIFDSEESFIFYNLTALKNLRLFKLSYREENLQIQPLDHRYKSSEEIYAKANQFFIILQNMVNTATLGKSQKIIQAEITIGYCIKEVYLISAEAIKVSNDYYHLSYKYIQQEQAPTKTLNEIFNCEMCGKGVDLASLKQINYDGAVIIRTQLKKSKYGLNPTKLYKVCRDCHHMLHP